MEIHAITRDDELDALEGDWIALLRRCGQASAQSSFPWLRAWWDHYGGDRELLVLVARDHGAPVGIAPLAITTTRAVKGLANRRTLGFLGQGSSDYGDFIVPERHEDVIEAFWDHLLSGTRSWDRLDLWEMREDSPNLPALRKAVARRGLECLEDQGAFCLQVDTDRSWEAVRESLKGKFRYDTRRRLAKLEMVGPVALVRLDSLDDRTWGEVLAVNRKHHQEFDKQNLSRNLPFLQDVTARLAARGLLDVALLRVGERTIAYNLGFRHRGTVSHWKVGFDPEFHRYAPGRLLIRYLVEQCCADDTRTMDFMRGNEPYKHPWVTGQRRNLLLTVRNARVASRFRSALRRKLAHGGGP